MAALGDTVVSGISIDTRTIQQGDLFVPFRGEHTNGHKFVMQAFEKGAGASLWQKDEPNPPEGYPLLFVDDPELALQEMARAYRNEHKAKLINTSTSLILSIRNLPPKLGVATTNFLHLTIIYPFSYLKIIVNFPKKCASWKGASQLFSFFF